MNHKSATVWACNSFSKVVYFGALKEAAETFPNSIFLLRGMGSPSNSIKYLFGYLFEGVYPSFLL